MLHALRIYPLPAAATAQCAIAHALRALNPHMPHYVDIAYVAHLSVTCGNPPFKFPGQYIQFNCTNLGRRATPIPTSNKAVSRLLTRTLLLTGPRAMACMSPHMLKGGLMAPSLAYHVLCTGKYHKATFQCTIHKAIFQCTMHSALCVSCAEPRKPPQNDSPERQHPRKHKEFSVGPTMQSHSRVVRRGFTCDHVKQGARQRWHAVGLSDKDCHTQAGC